MEICIFIKCKNECEICFHLHLRQSTTKKRQSTTCFFLFNKFISNLKISTCKTNFFPHVWRDMILRLKALTSIALLCRNRVTNTYPRRPKHRVRTLNFVLASFMICYRLNTIWFVCWLQYLNTVWFGRSQTNIACSRTDVFVSIILT